MMGTHRVDDSFYDTFMRRAFFASVVLAGSLSVLAAPMAEAVPMPPASIGVFPTWAVSGTAGSYTGTATFPASAGFPTTTFTSDSTTVRAPTGESAYLGASTGFGQNFGSTRSQPYLYLSQADGNTASTSTITFDAAPPSGWGFALGDIDADWVHIVPLDGAGDVLPASDLHAQDTDNDPQLNYCHNVPKPSACGSGPFTDVPAWLEAGGVYNGASYPSGAVVGSGSDTKGAYDWFLPSSDVRQLQLTFTRIPSGFPIYQLWLAAPAPAATVTGVIAGAQDSPAPEGTRITLDTAAGTPVLDIDDVPVTVPLAPDGSFSFVTEQGQYLLTVTVPSGFAPIAPISVDATTTDVALAPITVAAVPEIAEQTPPPLAPELAATGAAERAWPLLWAGLGALLLGVVLVSRTHRVPLPRHPAARLSAGRDR